MLARLAASGRAALRSVRMLITAPAGTRHLCMRCGTFVGTLLAVSTRLWSLAPGLAAATAVLRSRWEAEYCWVGGWEGVYLMRLPTKFIF